MLALAECWALDRPQGLAPWISSSRTIFLVKIFFANSIFCKIMSAHLVVDIEIFMMVKKVWLVSGLFRASRNGLCKDSTQLDDMGFLNYGFYVRCSGFFISIKSTKTFRVWMGRMFSLSKLWFQYKILKLKQYWTIDSGS